MRRYLAWIGAERMAQMGYDLDAMQTALNSVPTTWHGALKDAVRIAVAPAFAFFDYPVRKTKAKHLRKGRRIFVNN
jgi:hypothetical protein